MRGGSKYGDSSPNQFPLHLLWIHCFKSGCDRLLIARRPSAAAGLRPAGQVGQALAERLAADDPVALADDGPLRVLPSKNSCHNSWRRCGSWARSTYSGLAASSGSWPPSRDATSHLQCIIYGNVNKTQFAIVLRLLLPKNRKSNTN